MDFGDVRLLLALTGNLKPQGGTGLLQVPHSFTQNKDFK